VSKFLKSVSWDIPFKKRKLNIILGYSTSFYWESDLHASSQAGPKSSCRLESYRFTSLKKWLNPNGLIRAGKVKFFFSNFKWYKFLFTNNKSRGYMKRTFSFRLILEENQEKIKNKLAKFLINKYNIFHQTRFSIPKKHIYSIFYRL